MSESARSNKGPLSFTEEDRGPFSSLLRTPPHPIHVILIVGALPYLLALIFAAIAFGEVLDALGPHEPTLAMHIAMALNFATPQPLLNSAIWGSAAAATVMIVGKRRKKRRKKRRAAAQGTCSSCSAAGRFRSRREFQRSRHPATYSW